MTTHDNSVAYRFARRLNVLMPYGYICKFCTSEPDLAFLNPINQSPGLNTKPCVSC